MRFQRVENPAELFGELVRFVFRIYKSTSGKYPRMEWVEKKPDPDDFEGFSRCYGPFLKSRLEGEFDELYILRNGRITATFALVYRFEGKEIPWIPEDMRDRVYLEFLMVDERARGKGIGREIIEFSEKRAREMGRRIAVVTFEDIEAYDYYIAMGFRVIRRFGQFVVLER